MTEKANILNENDIDRIIRRISHEILERNKGPDNLVFIGLRKRGVPLAKRIAENIEKFEGIKIKTGKLDVTFYRDDIGQNIKPTAQTTDISFDIEGRNVILVDDVLYTGRSARAAMAALIDLGRPRMIKLAVLVDREGREMPIHADYAGYKSDAAVGKLVQVNLVESDGKDEVVIE